MSPDTTTAEAWRVSAARHESITRQGVRVVWWSAHRRREGVEQTLREHDGSVTPHPGEAEALRAASESDGWWG